MTSAATVLPVGTLYGDTLVNPPKPFCLEAHPGVVIDHTVSHTLVRLPESMPVCSSALLNGGYATVDQWLNLYVDKHTVTDESPTKTLQLYADQLGVTGSTLGMMTSAKMKSLRVLTLADGPVYFTAMVTSGLSNARRAGDAADISMAYTDAHSEEGTYCCGTINLFVMTNACLTPACHVEAIMIASEAKAACLQDMGVISPISRKTATGTGTDSLAIVGTKNGIPMEYIGKHLSCGEMLGRVVKEALSDTVRWELQFG